MSGTPPALYLVEARSIHAAGQDPGIALAAVQTAASAARPHASFKVPRPSGDGAAILHAPCQGVSGEQRIPELLALLTASMATPAESASPRAAWLLLAPRQTRRGAGLAAEPLRAEVAQALGCDCQPVSEYAATAALEDIARWLASAAPGARAWLLGVDSLLATDTLLELGPSDALARAGAEGLVPGEAAAAVALSLSPPPGAQACIRGWSSRPEPAAAAPAPGCLEALPGAVAEALAQACVPAASVQEVVALAAGDAASELEWAQCAARTWPTTLNAGQRHAIELGLMEAPPEAGRLPRRLGAGPVLGDVGAAWLPLVLGLAWRARLWQARWAALGVEPEKAPAALLCRHLGPGPRDAVVIA